MNYSGPERRQGSQQLGYLTGKVESLEGEVNEFQAAFNRHMEQEESHLIRLYDKLEELRMSQDEKLSRIEARLTESEKQLAIYKHVWWAVKAIAVAIGGGLATAVVKYWDMLLTAIIGR